MTGTDVEAAGRTTCGRPPAAHPSLALPFPCRVWPFVCISLGFVVSPLHVPGSVVLGYIARVTSAATGLWNEQIHFLSLFLWSPFSPGASVSCPGEPAEGIGVEGEGRVELFGLALGRKH